MVVKESFDRAEADRVFVYGTLRDGQAARSILHDQVIDSEPATLHGRMYAFRDGYPGVVLDPRGGEVLGELVSLKDLNQAFSLLDAYEGDDFVRRRVNARTADGATVAAWCYVLANGEMAREGQLIASGDWISYDEDA